MQVFLTPQQRSFFINNKCIELEMILPENELLALKNSAENLLAKRLHVAPEKLLQKPSADLFKEGRDLWRDDVSVKRTFISSRVVQMAAALFQADSLRVGFTHYLIAGADGHSPFPSTPIALKEICSFNNPLGAVLIKVDETPSPISEQCPLPQAMGAALFVSADYKFSFDLLFQTPGQKFYMIFFAPQRAVYILQKNDPLTHLLKKSGYAFGDALQDSTHPLFFKNAL
ncbi:MAG: hypothetical protein HYX48_02895 [Chlamydiales bacterium]|nr:hypothetical protein [Chlamydiales bacterium]